MNTTRHLRKVEAWSSLTESGGVNNAPGDQDQLNGSRVHPANRDLRQSCAIGLDFIGDENLTRGPASILESLGYGTPT